MKSLRDEIRLAAGDMDGFNFIQAFGLDFICTADFILATARISFQKGSVAADYQQPQSLLIYTFYRKVITVCIPYQNRSLIS